VNGESLQSILVFELFALEPRSMATLAKRYRTSIPILCLILIIAVLFSDVVASDASAAETVAKSQESGVRDFVEYWSASRLLLNGDNPYSPEELLNLQQSVGWPNATALVMWNPPWTFSFTLPFAVPSFSLAQFSWLLVQLLIVLICTQLLASFYGTSSGTCRVEWGVALSFVPTVFVLVIGQISPLVLAGITGFLVLESKGRSVAAGAALAIISIKPHLLYLFWFALLLWVCREGRWRVLLGFAIGFLLVALVPLYFDPHVYGHYLELYSREEILQPFDFATPTLRNMFPLLIGRSDGWLQSLPSVFGLAWLVCYWERHKGQWRWSEELPLVLVVSVTTSFFAWTYDYVVILPALIEVAAWIKRTPLPWYRSWAVLSYLTINTVHAVMRFWHAEEFSYVWVAPALMLSYIAYRHEKQTKAAARLAVLA